MNRKLRDHFADKNRPRIDAIRNVDSDFARSLIEQFDRKGSLSDKQWACVDRLQVNRHKLPLLMLRAMFDVTELTQPIVRYKQLRLTRYTSRSKFHGCIKIMLGDTWAGRIDKRGIAAVVLEEAVADLLEFESDPIEKAAVQGRLTGHCCFCGRPLETKESVGAGYGPVCAANWGLPWGDTARYDELKRNAIK